MPVTSLMQSCIILRCRKPHRHEWVIHYSNGGTVCMQHSVSINLCSEGLQSLTYCVQAESHWGERSEPPLFWVVQKPEVVLLLSTPYIVGWISHAVFGVGHFNICVTVRTTTARAQSVMMTASSVIQPRQYHWKMLPRGLGALARDCAGTALLVCSVGSIVLL